MFFLSWPVASMLVVAEGSVGVIISAAQSWAKFHMWFRWKRMHAGSNWKIITPTQPRHKWNRRLIRVSHLVWSAKRRWLCRRSYDDKSSWRYAVAMIVAYRAEYGSVIELEVELTTDPLVQYTDEPRDVLAQYSALSYSVQVPMELDSTGSSWNKYRFRRWCISLTGLCRARLCSFWMDRSRRC